MRKFIIATGITLLSSHSVYADQFIDTDEIANNGKGKVEYIELSGCGDDTFAALSKVRKVNGIGEEELLLDFDLEASSRRGESNIYCKINAVVNVPAGMKFRVNTGFVEGEVRTSDNGFADLHYRYRLNETGDRASKNWDFGPNTDKDFNGVLDIRNPKFTECSNRPQQVNLSAVINANVDGSSSDRNALRIVATTNNSSRWLWNWSKCDQDSDDDSHSEGLLPNQMSTKKGSTLKLNLTEKIEAPGANIEVYEYKSFYRRLGRSYTGTVTIFLSDGGVIVKSDSGYQYVGYINDHDGSMVWEDVDFGFGPRDVIWR